MEQRKFTRELRVEMVKLNQKRVVTVAKALRDSGAHGTALHRWVQECAADSQQAFSDPGQMKPERKPPCQGDTSKGEFLASDVGPVLRQLLTRRDGFLGSPDHLSLCDELV